MATTVRVDIVSDIVCPWCLIGWERLKRAAAMLEGEIEIDAHWLPFELNPEMPAAGVDRQAYLVAKFGQARAEEVTDRLAAAAAADGISMHFDRVRRQPNTFAAHRLLHWAEQEGRGTALKEALFQAHFVDGKFIGDEDTLVGLADHAGLDSQRAREVIETEALADDVRSLEARAREIGIQGVPFFILDQKLALSGAQAPEVMVGALREAVATREAA